MSSLNKVMLIGRVGKEPDIRHTADGKAIANLSLATSEKWKDKNSGEVKEATEWHRVVFFGSLADIVSKYINKGSQIYIEGKLQTRKWTNKDGQDQYTTEVVVDGFSGKLVMLGGKSQQSTPQQTPTQVEDMGDIPF